jgi:3-deoxy-alpha-D-manno-octulosonate 8-oxidase
MFRNFKVVPKIIFGKGSFDQLEDILSERRKDKKSFMVFLIDHAFENTDFKNKVPLKNDDMLIWTDTSTEPKTYYIDQLVQNIKKYKDALPDGVIGIGGGATMDIAKAVSLMLTNPGPSEDYQGWDLIKNPAIYHVGIPTLSGTGAEASRTAILTGPQRKLGINSDYTVFDQIVLDPELTEGAPADQRFYTGMDCYIHCVEALTGTYLNAFSQGYGEKAMELCQNVFLRNPKEAADELMIASYFGGMSIAYSQVGVCHALSYGLSFGLGVKHGIGNCIAFDYLEEFYPKGVAQFRKMQEIAKVEIPRGITKDVDNDILEKMITVALGLEPLWENALGKDWKKKMPKERIKELYLKM